MFSAGDRLMAGCETLAIDSCLFEQGHHDLPPLLGRTGPLSVHQQLSMLRAASRIAGDASLSVRVGLRLHPNSYGIAGLALQSSASLRRAMQVIVEYGDLLCLKVQLQLEHLGGEARLTLSNGFDLTPTLFQLCLQLEAAKMCTLLRDLSGCRIHRIVLAIPPELGPQLEAQLGVPILCRDGSSYISFESAVLDAPLSLSNAATNERCLRSCAELISSLRKCDEIRRKVRGMVLSSKYAVPTLSEIASRLFLSTRTLRRRLERAQTSYKEIVGEIRRDLAVGYLTCTTLCTSAIAELLGYSDTANFRQAFKRWTGESPQQCRRSAQSTEWAASALAGHVQRETNEYLRRMRGSASEAAGHVL